MHPDVLATVQPHSRSLLTRRTIAFILLSLFSCLSSFANEGEKPLMFWVGAGGGVSFEKNEQYSPLTHSGAVFRIEGGWALRARRVLWNGQISYSHASVSRSGNGGIEVESSLLTARTGGFILFPVTPISTTFAVGAVIEAAGTFSEGTYNHEIDVYNQVCLGGGPAVFVENKSLDLWTFRLQLSVPLAAYCWKPAWVNGSGGETFGEWCASPDFLSLEAKLSAGLRITERTEVLFFLSCVAQQNDKPFVSDRLHNCVGIGLEMDFGETK